MRLILCSLRLTTIRFHFNRIFLICRCHMKYFTYITLKKFIGFSHMINGNRTEWSPIRSVILRVINIIGRPRSGSLICQSEGWFWGLKGGSRTWWERDRAGWQRDRAGWPVLFITLVNIKTSQYFSKTKRGVRLKKKYKYKMHFHKKIFSLCLKIAVTVLMSQNSRCIVIVTVL